MNRDRLRTLFLRALGVMMLIRWLLYTAAIVPLSTVMDMNSYIVFWYVVAFLNLLLGFLFLFGVIRSPVVAVVLTLGLRTISSVMNYSATLNTPDDIEFGRTVLMLAFTVIDLVLLTMYLFGFRQNSRRLIMFLAIQAYVMLLQIVLTMHLSREFFNSMLTNTEFVLTVLEYLLLMGLLNDRGVSDQNMERMARDNIDRVSASLAMGSLIYLSDDDYSLIVSEDRSSWSPSVDSAVELETSIHATDFKGGFEITIQKLHGRDNIRLLIHDSCGVSFMNSTIIDITYVKEMTAMNGDRKARFYGTDGVFIDLMIGEYDPFVRSSLSV